MTYNDFLKETRRYAKNAGLTLCKHKRLTINGASAFYLKDRKTGQSIFENMTLASAHSTILQNY